MRLPGTERELILRLLTGLLREDVAGLRSRGRLVGDRWLVLGAVWIPVRRGSPAGGDLVADLVARGPFVLDTAVVLSAGPPARRRRLHAVLRVVARALVADLAPVEATEFQVGFAALHEEATAALLATALRRRTRARVLGRLRPELAGAAALGWAGAIGFETLAAQGNHPLYPLAAAKVGLAGPVILRSAPEHAPSFRLRWMTFPADRVERHGELPDWWPRPADPGLLALPVHPAADLDRNRIPALSGEPFAGPRPEPNLACRPTLSLRTVVPIGHPDVHLKLPLEVRTLGRLNLRAISRATLADGTLIGGLLSQVRRAESGFAERVLVADESTWLHTGDPLLAVLIRCWPGGLDGSAIVSVAGLAVSSPRGRPVLAELADRFWGGDLSGLIDAYLRVVIEPQVGLWLRYGIVLEAHPQNLLVAVDRPAGGPRIRLLVRDLDSARIDLPVLHERFGSRAPSSADLADQRLAATRPQELADLFVTTTLHQSVASVLIGTAHALGLPAAPLLARIRPVLRSALDTVAATDPQARDLGLLTGLLETTRLPVKRALTAATLLPKTRTGALDVNKYYGADAPGYL